MISLQTLSVVLAIATSAVRAQEGGIDTTLEAGNPAAETLQTFNKPTKSWSQWQPKPTYAYDDLPDRYMGDDRAPPADAGGFQWDQYGGNRCRQGEGSWHTNSTCQTAWLNDVNDWCVWGPHKAGLEVGVFEREALAYCTKGTHGTRLIPDGTIKSVHFVRTSDYIQITGSADFTSIGMVQGDTGGEMDPHGMDDLSNPIGGVLYTTGHPQHRGEPWFVSEWTNFMSWNQFCLRACWGNRAAAQCEHKYDIMGCAFNIPANYGDGFESCDGEVAPLQGIYGSSTFTQGDPSTPAPHPAPSSSNCQTVASINNKLLIAEGSSVRDASATPTSASASSMRTVGAGASSSARDAAASGGSGGSSGNSQSSGSSGAGLSATPMTGFAALALLLVAGGAFVL